MEMAQIHFQILTPFELISDPEQLVSEEASSLGSNLFLLMP